MLADLVIASAVTLLSGLLGLQARAILRIKSELKTARVERTTLEQDLQALLHCSRTLAARFHAQEEKQLALDAKLQSLRGGTGERSKLNDAETLLSEGLGVDKVASLCELSQGEAALLERWRARRVAA